MKKSLLAPLIVTCFVLLMMNCSKDHPVPHTIVNTYVIVPGSWSAPYAWESVKQDLEAKGQKVTVVQLPGHGTDVTTPYNTITLEKYRDYVINKIDSLNTKVILVGHSMAGMVISAVAEKIPLKIQKMIYVGAFLPKSGQSLLDLANTDTTSLLGISIRPTSQVMDSLDVVRANIIDIFIADGSDQVKALVISKYKLEPGIPFTEPVTLTNGNFGSVDKYFIHTLLDRAVTYRLQKRMVAAAGLTKTYQINTSHSAFLAKPDSLAILLENIVSK